MPEGIIDMEDMDLIFSVTDPMGIHRESVRVELSKEDPGSIGCTDAGIIEITVPETSPIQDFTDRLQRELEGMGYVTQDLDEDDEEED
ncbi:MAG: hypothetical protein BZY88_01845 [SAR202 cluster bacterium Io17-Chloro-G9]|nr:MAG: hypothetical protein BZY88_01845 [SAR202 cluster bacterium Io17-Chloro-G9]